MISFTYPQVFLLAIPVAALLLKSRARRRLLFGFQVAIAALLLLVLAQPKLRLREKGTDVIAVIDRSWSMPPEAPRRIKETLELLAEGRDAGDRLGVVTFGEGAQIQLLPSQKGVHSGDAKETPRHASDLAKGVETALALIPEGRPGRVLALSDGESTGISPASAARDAATRGVPIDYRLFARPKRNDIAVERVMLPEKVNSGEPFQFSAVVRAEEPVSAKYLLVRGERVVAEGQGRFAAGSNRLLFRDVLVGRGVSEYQLKLVVPEDSVPENNVAGGVVAVVNSPALMVVNGTGQDDNLTRAFRKAGLPLQLFAEGQAPVTLDALQGYRGVVLENVPASKLGRRGMVALAHFIESLGGGLLITGGPRSFANGGYFKSPLEPALPVSMEIREEHRKVGIALAIALDRSGSMQAPVGGGLRKMDLANLGTAAALEVLGPNDSVSVIAVDSAAHVILPLTPCDDIAALARQVKRIESMGGGIFVHTALLAAGRELQKAEQLTRHIILFSDAADSEQPGKYKELIAKFRKMNITVSVIGLGTEKDCDAELLKDIARRGEGQISFSDDPHDLPRLFAQDTITVTRSSFVEEATAIKALPGLKMVTGASFSGLPAVGGYNLTYLRPRANLGIRTLDEYGAPALAFWQHGLGRVVAATPEVDGKFTGPIANWARYGDFLTTLGRYILGSTAPEMADAKMTVRAGEGTIAVEIDPENPPREMSKMMAVVVPPSTEGKPVIPLKLPLEWVSPTRLEARFPVNEVGKYRAAVRMGPSSVLRTNPVTLPYSPEYAPRSGQMSGKETLQCLAKISGGRERLSIETVFEPPIAASQARLRDISLPFLIVLLVLVVLEIAERRLSALTTAARLVAGTATGTFRRVARALPAVARAPRLRRRARKAAAEETAPAEGEPAEAAPEPEDKPSAPEPEEESGVDQAFKRVKRRHRSGR